ncbi:MAG: hypothetical protein ACR2IP_11810 [Solirubrobacteraceae bacterium]
MFTTRELQSRIVRPSGLRLLQPLRHAVSGRSWENLTSIAPGGQVSSRTGRQYPMILMRESRSVFTSVCLVMEKSR